MYGGIRHGGTRLVTLAFGRNGAIAYEHACMGECRHRLEPPQSANSATDNNTRRAPRSFYTSVAISPMSNRIWYAADFLGMESAASSPSPAKLTLGAEQRPPEGVCASAQVFFCHPHGPHQSPHGPHKSPAPMAVMGAGLLWGPWGL